MKKDRSNIHTISVLVSNKPGVLLRCAQVFARRAFNIDSLVVSPTVDAKFSRMTITAQGDPKILEQIIKQTSKLIDVIHAGEHTGLDSVDREFALIKVKYTPQSKAIISKFVKQHNAKIIDDSDNLMIIEQSGTTEELDELELLMKKYGLMEMVRSGKLVMVKGKGQT